MRPVVKTTAVLANDADGICESQTPLGAGALSLDGALVTDGVGILPEAQILTATWAGNDTARTLTVVYKDADGHQASGTIAGANATTSTSSFYATEVISISVDAATAGALTVGAMAADGMVTASIQVDRYQTPFNVSVFGDITAGTMTYSAQYTADAPQDAYTNGFSTDASWRNVTGITAVAADDDSNIAFPVQAVRFIQTVGSATGVGKFTVLQGRQR